MNCGYSELEALSNSPEYTPLSRPVVENGSTNQIGNDLSEGEIEDDDDDDYLNKLNSSSEESECEIPLKKKKVPMNTTSEKLQPTHKNNRSHNKYNIWASSLQEQAVLDEFNKCDVQNVDRSRAVESYYYNVKPAFQTEEKELEYEKNEENVRVIASKLLESVPPNKRKRKTRKYHKGNHSRKEPDHDSSIVPRYLLDLTKTIEDSQEDIAQDIANKLYETKDELVSRVVKTIGKEKAIQFYNDTKKIEEEGGMQIKSQTRRRTPGGVYFFLVKLSCTPSENKIIFSEDRTIETKKKKKSRAQLLKKKEEQYKEQALKDNLKFSDNLHKELPNLLKTDLTLKNPRHEEVDVPSPPPSPVSGSLNPPPSPATDETSPQPSNSSDTPQTFPVNCDYLCDLNHDEMELS